MLRPARRASLVLTAATAAATAAFSVVPSPALAAPAIPSFGPTIEAFAAYDGQKLCDPTTKVGTAALRSLLMTAYTSTGDLGIVRACDIGGISEHKEGRAWDWAVNVSNATQEKSAQSFFAWAFAPDKYGNPDAMARRLGIMYMIHNQQIWSAYNAAAGWRPYTGPNPHTDHVHFSLSWPGARKSTTYWSPSASYTSSSGTTGVTVTSLSASTVAINAKYQSYGGSAVLGAPLSAERSVTGGRARDYAHGRIVWSAGTGAHVVVGAIRTKYDAFGGAAVLGLPTTDERAVTGGRSSTFTQGRVYWSSATGARVVAGQILAKYLSAGGPAVLGLPTTDELAAAGGLVSSFSGGAQVYWSAATGGHTVAGPVLTKYLAAGGPAVLGLPSTDVLAVAGGTGSTFTRGRVYWSSGTGAHVVHGAILGRYVSAGGPAALGLPTTDELAVAGGRRNSFVKGRVYWSSATGAHTVTGKILTRYVGMGGSGSSLGLPIGEPTAVSAGTQSRFQHGSLLLDRSGRVRLLG